MVGQGLWAAGTVTDNLASALESSGENRENKGKGKNHINSSNVSALKAITYGLRETSKSIKKMNTEQYSFSL